MISSQTIAPTSLSPGSIFDATFGQSVESKAIGAQLDTATQSSFVTHSDSEASLSVRLFDRLAEFKVFTSQVAMHIGEKRDNLFKQLDLLLDAEEWPQDDVPPEFGSFRTLLRALLVIGPARFPSLGASSNGHLVAAWTTNRDRLTIHCFPNDRIRWVLSVGENEERRAAAGESNLRHLVDELAPYNSDRWFR